MTLIPSDMRNRWSTRARRGALNMLKSLLEFRELIVSEGYREEGVLMQAYREAADSMLMSPETLRDYMGKVREYPKEKLVYWLSNGLSFDHLEKANAVAELAKRTPADLLNEAIDVGNADGKTMTVDEMVSFALGVVDKPRRSVIHHFIPLYERLGKFPSRFRWDEEKTRRYFSWLDNGKEFFV